MYSACLFCHGHLGRNEVVEHFPVGRRLAFDPAKGRLWAVCRRCERWNLTPIEERWESLEECERLFRGTKLRVSTDNIGLARLAEGLELVRIGAPQRPEMAAWRYGDQFGRRRRDRMAWALALTGTVAGVALLGPTIGLAVGSTAVTAHTLNIVRILYSTSQLRTKLVIRGAEYPLVVEGKHLTGVTLVRDDNPHGWGLLVPFAPGVLSPFDESHPPDPNRLRVHWDWPSAQAVFVGDEALRVARLLLPKMNRTGATRSEVQNAVKYLERAEDPQSFFSRETARARGLAPLDGEPLRDFPAPVRLALEMISHEDVERRALEGELAMLESAWRDAEAVARISDDLLVPTQVESSMAKLKDRS